MKRKILEVAILIAFFAGFVFLAEITPLSVACAATGFLVWLVGKVRQAIKDKKKESVLTREQRAALSQVGFSPEKRGGLVSGMILAFAISIALLVAISLLFPGFLQDWPGQERGLYQAIEQAESQQDYQQAVDYIRIRMSRSITNDERRALEAREVKDLISLGEKLRKEGKDSQANEVLEEAKRLAEAYGLDPQAQAIAILLRPTQTPFPTATPRPTFTPFPTATAAPPTPTATPMPSPVSLEAGTWLEIVRGQRIPGAAVFFVRVTGPKSNPVTGLQTKDFTVQIDGQVASAKVTDFDLNPLPKHVVIAIDGSGSMRGQPLEAAKAGAIKFIQQLGPNDEYLVLVFQGNQVSVVVDWTSDKTAVQTIRGIGAGGETPLNDTIYSAIRRLAGKTGRQILVLLTDGKDTSSLTTQETVLTQAPVVGAEIYIIGLGDVDDQYLTELAKITGGSFHKPAGPNEISAAFDAITELVGHQYAITVDGDWSGEHEVVITAGGPPNAAEAKMSFK